jgi:hypothetical protein
MAYIDAYAGWGGARANKGAVMINDVLTEAVEEIDRYLGWEIGPYLEADVRARIVALRDQMDALRIELDVPPADDEMM